MSVGYDQVEAVSTSVQDSSVLVQRSTLDLILFCFPFHMSQVRKAINPPSLYSCSAWVTLKKKKNKDIHQEVFLLLDFFIHLTILAFFMSFQCSKVMLLLLFEHSLSWDTALI